MAAPSISFPAWLRVSIANKWHFVQDLRQKWRSKLPFLFFNALKVSVSGWAPGIAAAHIHCWGSAGSPRWCAAALEPTVPPAPAEYAPSISHSLARYTHSSVVKGAVFSFQSLVALRVEMVRDTWGIQFMFMDSVILVSF